jgi:hypothetical protein
MSYDSSSLWIASWGPSSNGNIFKFDLIIDSLLPVFGFEDSQGFYRSGNLPVGKLKFKGNKVFGLTMFGGGLEVNHTHQISFPYRGTIFSIDKNTFSFQKLKTFDPGNPWGNYPSGSLTQDSGSYIFQMYWGGVLRYNSNSNILTKIKEFQNNWPDETRLIGDIHVLNNRFWGIYVNEKYGQNSDFGKIYSIDRNGGDLKFHHSFDSELIKDNKYYINHYVVSSEIERNNYTIYSDGNDLFGIINNYKNSSKDVLYKYDVNENKYFILSEFQSDISTRIEFWDDNIILIAQGPNGGIIQVNKNSGVYSYLYRSFPISINSKTRLYDLYESIYFFSFHADNQAPGEIIKINKFSGQMESVFTFQNVESVDPSKITIYGNTIYGIVKIRENNRLENAVFGYNLIDKSFEIIHVFKNDKHGSHMRFSAKSISFYRDNVLYAYEENDDDYRLDFYPEIYQFNLTSRKEKELVDLKSMEQNPWQIESLTRDENYVYGVGGISGIVFTVKIKSGASQLINFYGYTGDNGFQLSDTIAWAIHRGRLIGFNSDMDSIVYNPVQWKDSVCHPELSAHSFTLYDKYLIASGYFQANEIYEFDTDINTCVRTTVLDPLEYGIVQSNFIVTTPIQNLSELNRSIRVFPNPGSAELNYYELRNVNIEQISICDLNGRLLRNLDKAKYFPQSIDISDLQPGIYIIRFSGPSFNESHKFVKQ